MVVERCVSGVEDPLAFEEVAGGCGWSSVREEDGVEEREEEREEDEPWEEVGEELRSHCRIKSVYMCINFVTSEA